jgi:hypothetical protein
MVVVVENEINLEIFFLCCCLNRNNNNNNNKKPQTIQNKKEDYPILLFVSIF